MEKERAAPLGAILRLSPLEQALFSLPFGRLSNRLQTLNLGAERVNSFRDGEKEIALPNI